MFLSLAGVINMRCDMCGREDRLFKTDVEGSILNLCNGCSKFGKVMSVVREEKKEIRKKAVKKEQTKKEEPVWGVVLDYGDRIKKKREELGLKQEDFAKKLNEKVSLIHKIEINHFEPPIELARKIQKFLHINLIEQQDLEPGEASKTKSGHFTIGDFIKVKRK